MKLAEVIVIIGFILVLVGMVCGLMHLILIISLDYNVPPYFYLIGLGAIVAIGAFPCVSLPEPPARDETDTE